MPWQIGNKEHTKRLVNKGGRPPQNEIDLMEIARKRIITRLAQESDGIYHDWRKLVRKHPASANYAMDKILGDEQSQTPGAINIFITGGQPSPNLRPDGLQIRIGGGNGQDGDGGDGA
jgi:hypothetical protein